MKLTYRKANVGDVPALDILMSELMSDLFGKNNRARMEQVVAEMQQDARYYLAVACEGEQVVGTAMGVLCHDLCGECRPFMVIENVIVSQACRGKGVGRGLLEELERWGRAQGCTTSIWCRAHFARRRIGFMRRWAIQARVDFGRACKGILSDIEKNRPTYSVGRSAFKKTRETKNPLYLRQYRTKTA